MHAITPLEDGGHGAVVDAVDVPFGARVEARVKVLARLLEFENTDIVGDDRVQTAVQRVDRSIRLQAKTGDLPSRVHSRVRAARASQRDPLAGDPAGGLLDGLLYGRPLRLSLPAEIAAAVVLDRAFEVARQRVNTPVAAGKKEC